MSQAHKPVEGTHVPWPNALDCPKCHAEMTAIAIIEGQEQSARYLEHTGQATVHPQAVGPPDLAA